MKNDLIKSAFTQNYELILTAVLSALNQLIKKEARLDLLSANPADVNQEISLDRFPLIQIAFTASGYGHILSLPPELGLKFYAWMLEMDEDAQITSEHLEGLKEGASQIFGQVQAGLSFQGIEISFADIDIRLVDDKANFDPTRIREPGFAATYKLAVGDYAVELRHYIWQNAATGSRPENPFDAMPGFQEDEVRPPVRPVQFEPFKSESRELAQPRNIDMLMDVELEVLVELGRKRMLIKEILKLGKGSVVELDKAAGEPLGIFVNGRKLAEGEVVVIDDHFGVRITQLVGPKERIKSLG